MALPVLAKSWQYDVNITISAQGSVQATSKRLLRTIVDTLISGSSPYAWEVRGSSDGVSTSASYLWTDDSKIVYNSAGNNHSWVHLRQSAFGGSPGFEIIIDCTGPAVKGTCTIVMVNAGGFSGGTITNRPSAVNEIVVDSSSLSTVDVNCAIHVLRSTDGECSRVVVWDSSSNISNLLIIDKPANAVSGWTNPGYVVSMCLNSSGYANSYNNLLVLGSPSIPSYGGKKSYGSSSMDLMFTGEGMGYKATGTVDYETGICAALSLASTSNDLTSEWPMFPIGLASLTSGNVGRHGSVFDLWWRPNGTSATGETFPATGSAQFVAMGDLILPWNGTTPVIA